MRMGQGVRTGLGHGGITCVLQTQFSSLSFNSDFYVSKIVHLSARNLPRKPNNQVSEEPRQN